MYGTVDDVHTAQQQSLTAGPGLPPGAPGDSRRDFQAVFSQAWLWHCLEKLAWVVATSAITFPLIVLAYRFLAGAGPDTTPYIGTLLYGLLGLVLGFVLVYYLPSAGSRLQAAAALDRAAGTGDRLVTGLRLAGSGEGALAADPWKRAALAECVRYLRNVRFQQHLRWPDGRVFLPLIVVAWGALVFGGNVGTWLRAPGGAELAALEAEQARQQEVSAQLEVAAQRLEQNPDAAAQALAEKLRETARELAASKAQRAEDLRAEALRRLAALEAAARAEMELRTRNQGLDQEQSRSLAEALKASPDFAEAGRRLAEGQAAQAAEGIRDTLSRLDEERQQDAVDAVSAALSRQDPQKNNTLTRKDEKPTAAQEAMQGLASQITPQAAQALRELAEMLRQMGAQQPGGQNGGQQQQGKMQAGQPGEPMSPQTLEKLMQALQNMKEQARGGEGQGMSMAWPGDDGERNASEENQTFMMSAGGASQDNAMSAMVASPLAGSDQSQGMDTGTMEPLGESPFDAGHLNRSEGLRLNGLLGEGESLLTLTPGRAENAAAGTRYQEIYQATQPALQEALNREDIPLGSRELIKRYFEEIRP